MKKLTNHVLVLWAIALVAVAALIVVLPFEHGSAFWLAGGCTLAMFALIGLVFKRAFRQRETLESKLLGWPLFQAGFAGLAVQVVAGFALMALGNRLPFIWALLIEAVILLCVAVVLITRDAAKITVLGSEESVRERTEGWKTIRAKAKSIAETTGDPEIRRLAEDIRYADPTPTGMDGEISEALDTLADDPAEEKIRAARLLLAKRNQLAKESKE